METLSTGVLIVLALAAFNNFKKGNLPMWLRAKFFNQAPGDDPGEAAAAPGGLLGPTFEAQFQAFTPGGVFLAPVAGPVTSPFGPRNGKLHAGIDYGVPVGTPVGAARAGRVISAASSGGYGLKVDLDHGSGVVTRYAHLDKINVRVGATVPAGATVGLSGNTGRSTGPHLHFEVRVAGVAKDPAGYLAGASLGTPVSA